MRLESNLEYHYYHGLPDSEQKLEEDDQSHQWRITGGSTGNSCSKKPRLNRYALACAVLASTNSVLLGYGEFQFNLFGKKNFQLHIKFLSF